MDSDYKVMHVMAFSYQIDVLRLKSSTYLFLIKKSQYNLLNKTLIKEWTKFLTSEQAKQTSDLSLGTRCNTFRLFVAFFNPIRKRSPGNTNFSIREKTLEGSIGVLNGQRRLKMAISGHFQTLAIYIIPVLGDRSNPLL